MELTEKEITRFWKKVVKSDNCWNWTGSKSNEDYGRIRFHKSFYAHRISWVIHHGFIPKDMCVLHSCDNRSCINPHHLWIGTQQDNLRDMVKKGRNRGISIYGSNNVRSKLTEDQVVEIRCLYKRGRTKTNTIRLSYEFNVDQSVISRIINRKAWSH